MLQLDNNPTFDADVCVNLKAFKAEFGATFKLLDNDEVDALRRAWLGVDAKGQKLAGTAADQPVTDADIVAQVLVGWRGVTEAQGEVAFTAAKLPALLKKPGVQDALIAAFFAGYREAEVKNSNALPAA